jgi:hypothetical protein
MAFRKHTSDQITWRLAERANEQLKKHEFTGVKETVIQYVFNASPAAVYANLSKEQSYDLIQPMQKLTARNTFLDCVVWILVCLAGMLKWCGLNQWSNAVLDLASFRAAEIVLELNRVSKIFAHILKDFEYDPANIKQ